MNQLKNIKISFVILFIMTFFNIGMLIFNYNLWKNNNQNQTKTSFSADNNLAQAVENDQISTNKNATVITIKAVGDMVPGSSYSKTPNIKDKMKMFDGVKSQLQGADFLFGNLETALTNHRFSTKDTSQRMMFAFRTAPSYSNFLKEVGFDIFNIANNHTFDYGEKGFNDTLENLKKVEINHIGEKDQILYLEKKGLQIAWIGFSYFDQHNNMNNLEKAKELIQEAKANADFVVVSVQGGAEGGDKTKVKNQTEMFYGENRGNMKLFSRTMIDEGADLIIGHGPHVLRGMELYKGKLIAYSLGNFVGDGALSREGILANSIILEVTLNSKGDFIKGKIIPVKINPQGFPFYDNQFSAVKMIQNLVKSDFPESNLLIKDTGELSIKN
jgi:poly-gamma-glutamate capsule biosynthesis protein CapA/YwtB (metallophosphatase superfamily)